MITVCRVTTTLRPDGICSPLTFFPVRVPLSLAADLSNEILGGALVRVAPHPPRCDWPGAEPYVTEWPLQIVAFTETDAYQTVYEVAGLLSSGGKLLAIESPVTYRFQCGELVPADPFTGQSAWAGDSGKD